MLTSKQRSTLRGIASKYETILQVGKGGISEALVQQVKDALRKRELIKMRVLDNCPLDAREAAEELAARTGSEVVQVIGSRFVLFLRNSKEPVVQFLCSASDCSAAASIPSITAICIWCRRQRRGLGCPMCI